MSEPFSVVGWAVRWNQHTCNGSLQNTHPVRYSQDFSTVREFIYDRWATYRFHILVHRLDKNYHLFLKGELLAGTDHPVISMGRDSPDEKVDPRKSWVMLVPDNESGKPEDFVGILYWPSKIDTYYTYGSTKKFQFTIGWRSTQESAGSPPQSGKSLETINIFITDVIGK